MPSEALSVDIPADVLSASPEWLVGLVVALVLLNWLGRVLSEASETWAKILGPLGRRWRGRAQHRQETRAAERTARMADLEDMTRQRDALDAALSDCRTNQSDAWDYIVHDADWHRRLRLSAAEAGCSIPDHQSFTRWKQDQ